MSPGGGGRWTVPTAIGGGVTTFLVVAVAVIELVEVAFSAIVGLPLGLAAGLAAAIGIRYRVGAVRPATRRVVRAYATLGPVLVALLGLRYVGLGRDLLSVGVMVGIALLAGVAVFLWLRIGGASRKLR